MTIEPYVGEAELGRLPDTLCIPFVEWCALRTEGPDGREHSCAELPQHTDEHACDCGFLWVP